LRAAAIWRGNCAQACGALQADVIFPLSCRAPIGLPFRSAHIFFLPKTALTNIEKKKHLGAVLEKYQVGAVHEKIQVGAVSKEKSRRRNF